MTLRTYDPSDKSLGITPLPIMFCKFHIDIKTLMLTTYEIQQEDL